MGGGTSLDTIPKIRNVYYDTKSNLDALTGLSVGDLGYATDQKILYRWSGSAWQIISQFAAYVYQLTSAPKVYDANAPTNITSIDLSSIIGTDGALVLLIIKNKSGGALDYTFAAWATDEGHVWTVADGDYQTTHMIATWNGGCHWKASGAGSTELYVMGYLK